MASITKQIIVSNVAPVANFSYSPENPTTADVIQFTDLSYDSDGYIVNWTWNFGDGAISYEQNPQHSYSDDGIYNVTLIVTDDDRATNNITKQIIVLPSDKIPPTTIKTVGYPKYGASDEWVNSSTQFNLTAHDNGSGVNKTYYRIWYNGSWTTWIEYTGNFTLQRECKHYIEYHSIDNAGNIEVVHNQTHYVDNLSLIHI